MSDVTDADREKAGRLLDDFAPMGGTRRLLEEIAHALADEREKARAPFLALADELKQISDWWNDQAGTVPTTYDICMGKSIGYVRSAERIRRVAEESGE